MGAGICRSLPCAGTSQSSQLCPTTLAWTGVEQALESHATEDRAPTPEQRTPKATWGLRPGRGALWSLAW